jgi:hypothetical protein
MTKTRKRITSQFIELPVSSLEERACDQQTMATMTIATNRNQKRRRLLHNN